MINIGWTMRGIAIIFLAFFVALPISFFLPFLGVLAVLPFSDAVLIGLAAMIAGLVPTRSRVARIAVLLLLWIGLSLAFELPNVAERVSDLIKEKSPQVHLDRLDRGQVPQAISLVGVANPILAADGFKWEIELEINLAGMRESMGKPLVNIAHSVDIPNLLWSRGIESRIGDEGYPRLSVKNEVDLESSNLKLEYLKAPNQVVATYERKIPLPAPYPGVSIGGLKRLLSSIFYSNLWREVLSVNKPVILSREVDSFLDGIVGASKAEGKNSGPIRSIEIEQEQIVTAPEGLNISELFRSTNGIPYGFNNAGERQWDVCGRTVVPLEFGGPGTSTYLLGLTRSDNARPALLRHISPDDAIFAFHCEQSTQHVIALSRFGSREKPLLRISRYDSIGTLQSVDLFKLPRWLGRDALIVPGTWERIDQRGISFQMMERIRSINASRNEVEDPKSYRLIKLQAK